MAAKRTKSSRVTRPSRRTQIVWVTFLAAMTAVTAMLAVQGTERRTGFLLTDRQYAQLINLVQRLQAELHIPARNVYLHRDLSDQTTSPGKFFALARVQEQLLK